MDNWQSIVLLTIETPHPVREDVVRRLTRWTGLEFGEAKEASRNFVVLDSRGGMLKLDGDQLFVVTALERPYFASEDIEPYEEQAGFAGDQRMVNLLRTCRGAILIDAHIIQRPYDSLRRLAQIAAAMMAPDTPVMLVPPSAKALAVTGEVRSAMGRAADVAALMPYVMGFHVLEAAGQAVCFTGGMPMLMLPDVMMRCTPGEVEAAAAAVQSLASYMVARRQAVPVGDTMELGPPGGRALRIVPAELGGHSWDPSERIALVPAGGGPGGGPAAPPRATDSSADRPAGPAGTLGNLARATEAAKPGLAQIKASRKRMAAKSSGIALLVLGALYLANQAVKVYWRHTAPQRAAELDGRAMENRRAAERSADDLRRRLRQAEQTPLAPGSAEEEARRLWLKARQDRPARPAGPNVPP